MAERLKTKKGYSTNQDAQQAVAELVEKISQPQMSVVIIFCSSQYALAELGPAIKAQFNCPVIGCTTAGEITAEGGYLKGTLTGVSISSAELKVYPKLIQSLNNFNINQAQMLSSELQQELELSKVFNRSNHFSLLFIDGMSMLEEQVVACLNEKLPDMSIVGGSAGDDLAFQKTYVYWDGAFVDNAALFTLFETTLPFKALQTQHFEATDSRLVVTESQCETRTVTEINGGPAAEEYARVVGVDISNLTPQIFAAHPVMLKIGNKYHVRSIQKSNPDGSLTFYCAIDTGLVLRVGKGAELLSKLKQYLDEIHQTLPNTQLILGCDCVLRRLELEQKELLDMAKVVLHGSNFVGFSTYGEQINGIHVNQTLTGIALAG